MLNLMKIPDNITTSGNKTIETKMKEITEPINFFITSTKIKQNDSNFVHLNFRLYMIMPKSFSNLGCFAQKIWSLQNMFQMTSSALETD